MKKLFCEYDKIAYYVTDDGQIWSYHKGTNRWFELKPGKNRGGYLYFFCYQNRVKRNIQVHRAVWEAFHGPIPEGMEINHINTIRDDNRLLNLELVTRSQNNLHPPTREHAREAKRHQMKPVLDVTTGVVYESAHEASRQTGLHSGNISACCLNKQTHTGGHVFRFAS